MALWCRGVDAIISMKEKQMEGMAKGVGGQGIVSNLERGQRLWPWMALETWTSWWWCGIEPSTGSFG
jgi:hypothetical protein